MRNDTVIFEELQSAQAEYNASQSSKTAALIKELRAELSAYITDGANACPDCGKTPHGLRQEVSVSNEKFIRYEIGCLNCRNHHSRDFNREKAVARWNDGDYNIPAK